MEATDIKIKIKQTDKTFDVTIKSNMNILQVKEIIGAQINTKPAEMKLIYKGKILKDTDTVQQHQIINDQTMHLVVQNKPAADQQKPQQQAQTSSQQQQSQVPPNLNSGTGQMPFGLGSLGMGFPGLGGLGGQANFMQQMNNVNMQQLMSDPAYMEMMNQILSDPQQLQQLVSLNPMLQQMVNSNPMMKEMFSNPQLMQQIMNPQNLQQISQLMQSGGLSQSPLFGMGNFGLNQNNPNSQQPSSDSNNSSQQSQQQTSSQQQQQVPPFNIQQLLNNPMFSGMMNQMQQPNINPQPQENLTPEQLEEKYKTQLEQLNNMGFTNKQLNLETLQKTNGNVEVAVERLLKLLGDNVN